MDRYYIYCTCVCIDCLWDADVSIVSNIVCAQAHFIACIRFVAFVFLSLFILPFYSRLAYFHSPSLIARVSSIPCSQHYALGG